MIPYYLLFFIRKKVDEFFCAVIMSPMNSNNAKRSRGRPKGSTSFVKVKLSDLNKQLGSNAPVSVSKKWLIDIGMIADEAVAPIEILQPSQPEEPKIQFTIK